MMDIRLRPARETDKEFCRRVHHTALHDVVVRQFGQWDDALQDEFFEKSWVSLSRQIIEVNGAPAGTFSCAIYPDHLVIEQIYLLPRFQGQGIGTGLLRQQLDKAQELKIPARLNVLLENRARILYERLGFKIAGKTEIFYHMEKPG